VSKPQWIAVSLSVILVLVLYVFGDTTHLQPEETERVSNSPPAKANDTASASPVLDRLRARHSESLSQQDRDTLQALKERLKQTEKDSFKLERIRDIAHFWKHRAKPEVAGHYFEQAAQKTGRARDWQQAGDAYNVAFRQAPDTLKTSLAQKAIHSYKKALSLKPQDTSLKLSLATCYTDGTDQVMKGVRMLLDITEADSTHPEANFHLGRLAIRSGQHDKAIDRMQVVLSQDSTDFNARLLLSQALLNKGEKEQAVQVLKQTRKWVTDSAQRKQLDQYINQIINS
jgi:cytochrome c-type biogenesis protein CcmH/NrfG